MNFSEFDLSTEIKQAITEMGYEIATPIQEEAIPIVLKGHDLMAAAQTGTGKTAAFSLPIIEKLLSGKTAGSNQARTLILTPTRELAAQIYANVEQYSKKTQLRSAVVFGGVKINPQMMKLRKGVDILVATPGRLLDLHSQNAVHFDNLEFLVLDEADRMLDMGFIHDIKKIISKLPKKRQSLLFSATFSKTIRSMAKQFLNTPKEISIAPEVTTAEKVEQKVIPVDRNRKAELLIHLIKDQKWDQVLIFSRTKHGANKLVKKLEAQQIQALAIHGNKSQNARTKALKSFKDGEIQALVATDIAARGIDIDLLPYVVNFDLPNVSEDYVHRIGRTGRAGAEGLALSLVCIEEYKELRGIEKLIGKAIPQDTIEGFEPEIALKDAHLHVVDKPKQNQRGGSSKRNFSNNNQSRGGGGRNKARGGHSSVKRQSTNRAR